MANPYPNVSVALDMNAKMSGSLKDTKSRLKKDFYAKIRDKKKSLWQGFLGWVLWVGFFVPTLVYSDSLSTPTLPPPPPTFYV